MEKQAFVSKHIVLSSAYQLDMPVYGILLIEGEIIQDLVILDPSSPVSQVIEEYKEWNPEDLSDYYISPGIIDLSVRTEWESYSDLTKAAISGGVTLILDEKPYYNENLQPSELFCDIGKVALVGTTTAESIPVYAEQGVFAVKGYLFPPHCNMEIISDNLTEILSKIEACGLTFIIDPTLPDERMLHSVSPYRFKEITQRISDHSFENSSFAGGFPDSVDNEFENEDDKINTPEEEENKISNDGDKTIINKEDGKAIVLDEEEKLLDKEEEEEEENRITKEDYKKKIKNKDARTILIDDDEQLLNKEDEEEENKDYVSPLLDLSVLDSPNGKKFSSNRERSFSHDVQYSSTSETSKSLINLDQVKEGDDLLREQISNIRKSRRRSNTIDDLDIRIRNSQLSIRDLSNAEYETYKQSGITQFSPTKKFNTSFSFDSLTSLGSDRSNPSPGSPSPSLFMRRKIQASLPILVKSRITPQEGNYRLHMACYSDNWETTGIEKVLQLLSDIDTRVHFSAISAAKSFNLIRKSKVFNQLITCEIPGTNLYFSSLSIPDSDTRFKCSPPIRNNANLDLLWELLTKNAIDAVSSNHCTILPEYKRTDGDFKKSVNGMPTIGLNMQAVWTKINDKIIRPSEKEGYIVAMAKWFSEKPAEILNIGRKRGSIDKGKVADIIVWNPYEKFVVHHESTIFPGMSPFLNKELYGKIARVYLRGQIVYNKKLLEPKGKLVFKMDY